MVVTQNSADAVSVILVDENDREIGIESKLKAHQDGGKLHRAFSIFLVNAAGQMLLQQRSRRKYHFGGLWTNACCSHPRPGETLESGARSRLKDELGVEADLREVFDFVYRAQDPVSGLTEHELDHVFIGRFEGTPEPDPSEVDGWKWVGLAELLDDVAQAPQRYTPWFAIALQRVISCLPAVQERT